MIVAFLFVLLSLLCAGLREKSRIWDPWSWLFIYYRRKTIISNCIRKEIWIFHLLCLGLSLKKKLYFHLLSFFMEFDVYWFMMCSFTSLGTLIAVNYNNWYKRDTYFVQNSRKYCIQPIANDLEIVGYLFLRLLRWQVDWSGFLFVSLKLPELQTLWLSFHF